MNKTQYRKLLALEEKKAKKPYEHIESLKAF